MLATSHLNLHAPETNLDCKSLWIILFPQPHSPCRYLTVPALVDVSTPGYYDVTVRKVVIGLVWRLDTFFIKLYYVTNSSVVTKCEAQCRERRIEQERLHLSMLGLSPGICKSQIRVLWKPFILK